MIKGFKITLEQKELLVNEKFDDSSFFNPVQDNNGDWFIFSEKDQNKNNLLKFLKDLKEVEFVKISEKDFESKKTIYGEIILQKIDNMDGTGEIIYLSEEGLKISEKIEYEIDLDEELDNKKIEQFFKNKRTKEIEEVNNILNKK
jgi:hypothetical protein